MTDEQKNGATPPVSNPFGGFSIAIVEDSSATSPAAATPTGGPTTVAVGRAARSMPSSSSSDPARPA